MSVGELRSLMARLTGVARMTHAPDDELAARLRDMRSVAVGSLGEALVRAELEALCWPMLRNAILVTSGHSVEIDQLACARGGIVVLETKTYSGHVDGSLASECWTLRLRDGRSFTVPNAFRQNAAHMRAVRAVINDEPVCVRGYVVSAGGGRFAPVLARAMVPVAELRTHLAEDPGLRKRGGAKLAAAWLRLVAAATDGEVQRAAHAARMAAYDGNGSGRAPDQP